MTRFRLVTVDQEGVGRYSALQYYCPGCAELFGYDNALMSIPVNHSLGMVCWAWNERLINPTLSPMVVVAKGSDRCESVLRNGFIEFTENSTHGFAGQKAYPPRFPKEHLTIPERG